MFKGIDKMKKKDLIKNLKETVEVNKIMNETIMKLNEDKELLQTELKEMKAKMNKIITKGVEQSPQDKKQLEYLRKRYNQTGQKIYLEAIKKLENIA